MHSVANLATLQTPLAIFFPSKKHPNLISFLRITGTAAQARGLASQRAHNFPSLSVRQLGSARTPLSPSLSVRQLGSARTHLSLPLSRCVSSVQRAHTSLSLSLGASARFSAWQLRCSTLSQTRYYVASLILHASIAEITAQLLPLCYVYLISSDSGSIIRIFVQINILEGRASFF